LNEFLRSLHGPICVKGLLSDSLFQHLVQCGDFSHLNLGIFIVKTLDLLGSLHDLFGQLRAFLEVGVLLHQRFFELLLKFLNQLHLLLLDSRELSCEGLLQFAFSLTKVLNTFVDLHGKFHELVVFVPHHDLLLDLSKELLVDQNDGALFTNGLGQLVDSLEHSVNLVHVDEGLSFVGDDSSKSFLDRGNFLTIIKLGLECFDDSVELSLYFAVKRCAFLNSHIGLLLKLLEDGLEFVSHVQHSLEVVGLEVVRELGGERSKYIIVFQDVDVLGGVSLEFLGQVNESCSVRRHLLDSGCLELNLQVSGKCLQMLIVDNCCEVVDDALEVFVQEASGSLLSVVLFALNDGLFDKRRHLSLLLGVSGEHLVIIDHVLHLVEDGVQLFSFDTGAGVAITLLDLVGELLELSLRESVLALVDGIGKLGRKVFKSFLAA